MLFLLAPFLIAGALASPLTSVTCFKPVTELTSKLGLSSPWQLKHQGKTFSLLESPATKEQNFSAWLVNRSDEVTLVIKKGEDLLQHQLSGADCRVSFRVSKANEIFSSLDFYQAAVAHPKFVVVLWSPHMQISKGELEALKGKSFDVPVFYVMDESADLGAAKDYIASKNFPESYLRKWQFTGRLPASIEHYPSAIFVKDGVPVKYIPGFNGPITLKQLIREHL